MFFEKYPNTDFHELNLDWLLHRMRELQIQFDEFVVVNHITFSGQWDITKQYPAWTIVSDNNIGYVSIQPVPVGVVLTNTDYWVEVIDYTAQIAGLQTRVVALENTVGDVNSGLVKDVNDLQTDVSNLKQLTSKRYLFIGDSYNSISGASWSADVISIMGLQNAAVCSQGGYGFYRDGVLKWQTLLENTVIANPETITDVVICGGANDAGVATSNLYPAMQDMDTYLKTRFPNIQRIHLGFVAWRREYGVNATQFNNTLLNYKEECYALGWRWLNNVEYTLRNLSLISTDPNEYFHPTPSGVHQLGKQIAQVLMTGSTDIVYSQVVSFRFNPAYASGTDFNISAMSYNGSTTINFPDINFAALANITGPIKLATCTQYTSFFQHTKYIPFSGKSPSGAISGIIYQDNGTDLYIWLRSGTITSGNAVTISANNLVTCNTYTL